MKESRSKSRLFLGVILSCIFCLYACASITLFKSEQETKIEGLSYKLGLLYTKDNPDEACIAYTFCKEFEMAYREDYRIFLDVAIIHLNKSKLSDETKAVFQELLSELSIRTKEDIYKADLEYSLFISMAEQASKGISDGIQNSVCKDVR